MVFIKMKIRADFVTNSSSTAYYITNKSDKMKTIVDFVKENLNILKEFNEEYGYEYTEEELIKSAQDLLDNSKDMFKSIKPGQVRLMGFGDEDGTVIGHVFDYGLRDGGKSESFEYEFYEYWR